ncbi:hypothetical protein PHYPSEUDO_009793 [Phytophthora pseudosyringae]|uniref:Uncharacterized protein n=1 Tax=Phytophthora pseudosyringae TaxID=221518 RepID=A0A8T1VEP7_9STRA|nr:hypothetical protein PHYPSEUDO_009793 [Phytophthora pseudosyringae]
MPTRALASSEEDSGDGDDRGDLVTSLESYTRELGTLCGGLEVQQLEAEGAQLDEDVDVGPDTLASLEEMTGECAALLACLEAGENGSDEEVNEEDEFGSAVEGPNHEKNKQQPQEDEPNDPCLLEAGLAHELDSFANELTDFLSCLGEAGTEENALDIAVSSSPMLADTADQPGEEKKQSGADHEENPSDILASAAASTAAAISVESVVVAVTDGANSSPGNEVFSERTKKAIALHIKRLALQKQRRNGTGARRRVSAMTKANNLEAQTERDRVPGAKVGWSRFQSTSFQQHIMRQKFARRRVQQTTESRRLVEAARLKRSKPISYHNTTKSDGCKSSNQDAQRPTYLDQFKPTSAHHVTSSEYEPRYLCAVYLYGLRRLGTTYITFSSLAQLEQRVLAKFAIGEAVSIYREVTEAVLPKSALGRRSNRKRHVKRLQRLSTLEHVNDGDTLCVTQNSYEDMAVLCDWIKQRQRVVHDFQYEVRQPSTDVPSALTDDEPPPPQARTGNAAGKAQLWDSNGRSIGVKVQHAM